MASPVMILSFTCLSTVFHLTLTVGSYDYQTQPIVAIRTPPEDYIQTQQNSPFKIALFADLHFGENAWTDWGLHQDFNSVQTMSTLLDKEMPGLLVEDILHLASDTTHASNNFVHAPIVIGCGNNQSGGYLNGIAPDGLMGLGLGEISVPNFLAKARLMRNSSSLCLDEDNSGMIFFEDQGLAIQQTTPFLPSNGKYVTYTLGTEARCIESYCLEWTSFKALVDSGFSFTYIPEEVYKRVVQELIDK